MSLHESISAFRGVKKLVESFDPMNDKADFPDIAKAAGAFKKASQQADAIRAQADESPEAHKALWQSQRAKKDAHAALVGRTVVDFPHLSAEDALHVAGKHIKQGNMQPHEHISVLSDLWGARDHNEHGVTFNTPARKTRAEGFIKCLSHHHPEIQAVKKDMPTEGLTAVQFPGMEHMPPEAPPEEQPEQPEQQPQQPKPPVDTANPDEPDQFSPEQAAQEMLSGRPFRQFESKTEEAERWERFGRSPAQLTPEARAKRADQDAEARRRADTVSTKQQDAIDAEQRRIWGRKWKKPSAKVGSIRVTT